MTSHYALLDSGNGVRLERFGARTLARPCSLAVWKPRHAEEWRKAAAIYDHENGWKINGAPFEEWTLDTGGLMMTLRLQRNGQIGFFPEHTLYLEELAAAVKRSKSGAYRTPNVLNLFAFTGMASVAAIQAGAQVTHVDILKPALDWARINAESNKLPADSLRLIPEDALAFMEREVKRGKRYDLIILDPPSFSRTSKTKSWDLPDILPRIAELLAALLEKSGEIFFTCHGTEHGAVTMENLLFDAFPKCSVESRALLIPELDSPRRLASGHLVRCSV